MHLCSRKTILYIKIRHKYNVIIWISYKIKINVRAGTYSSKGKYNNNN